MKRNLKDIGRTHRAIIHILFVAIYLCYIIPMMLIVSVSFSSEKSVTAQDAGYSLIPREFSVEAYKRVFANPQSIIDGYIVTASQAFIGTLCSLVILGMTAYPLSRTNFAYKKPITFYIFFTMLFSGGLIPTFILTKSYGLYNNPLIMVISGLVGIWNVMVARSMIANSLPDELYEAAMMDGCSHFRYFFFFIIPLSQALMAIMCVRYAVGHWNDYMTALIYLNRQKYFPVQVVVRNLVAVLTYAASVTEMMHMDEDLAQEAMRLAQILKYCVIIVTSGPIIILYLFLQKYFVHGTTVGSLKG